LETAVSFRAWRYAPTAGEPAGLIAPPYDVIDASLQSRLYARSPYNVVRVDLGMSTPSDNDCDNRYTRAAAQLEDWKSRGILVRDDRPSITFVEERFTGPDGRPSTRNGFLALMRLYDFGEKIVFPHEQTLSGPKDDRFRLMLATGMSLSPVFLLYDLPGDDVTALWRHRVAPLPPDTDLVGDDGTVTRLWQVSESDLLGRVEQVLESSRFIIADGHHRYETALAMKSHCEQMRGADDPHSARRGWNYALAYFGNMADPGLSIYSTHRLVANLPEETIAGLPGILRESFVVEEFPLNEIGGHADFADAARAAIATFLADNPRGAFGFWGHGMTSAFGLRLRPEAASLSYGEAVRTTCDGLDVGVLQTLVLENALGLTGEDIASGDYVAFVKDPREAFELLESGDFQVGFFVNPTGLDQIRDVAFSGRRMPQKATFFYPKLPTGLVFHELEAVISG